MLQEKRFLLYLDQQAVGVLWVRPTKYAQFAGCGELGALYLLRQAQKQGYGKLLFNFAKEALRKMGYLQMVMGCLVKNPSNKFYQHLGCQLVGSATFVVAGQAYPENVYQVELSGPNFTGC